MTPTTNDRASTSATLVERLRRPSSAMVGVLVGLALLTGCGGGQSLDLTIRADERVERLGDLGRLQIRAFELEETTEVWAEATDEHGQVVRGIDCDAVEVLDPDATDCVEHRQPGVQDGDMIASAVVPSSGRLSIDRPDATIRVYAELPGEELRVDEFGRVCRWNASATVAPGTDAVQLTVAPRC